MATPFMSLTLPTVSITIGPTWATQLNAALTLIDSHQHTPGTGQLVPTTGLNINADLTFSNFNATTLRTTRYFNQSAPLALPTDINCLFVSGGELWFNNQAGVPLQLTSNGSLSVGSIGGITGLGGTSAALNYTSGTGTFVFTQNPSQAANIDAGNVIIHNPIGTGNPGVTLSVGALSGSYVLTLASALPGSTSFLTSTATGQLGYIATLGTLTTANLSASAAIKGTQLASNATILGTQLTNQTITATQIANATITRTQEAAVGQQLSGGSGAFTSTAGGGFQTVVSVGLTTIGRPVIVSVQPDTSTGAAFVQPNGTTQQVLLRITRDATEVARWAWTPTSTVVAQPGISMPMMILDPIGSGGHTWNLQVASNPDNSTITVNNYLIAVYEL